MDEALFDEWWARLNDLHGELLGQVMEGITPLDVAKYLDELHEKVDKYDTLEGEIANLKHTINRL